jgi:hypothetical protein
MYFKPIDEGLGFHKKISGTQEFFKEPSRKEKKDFIQEEIQEIEQVHVHKKYFFLRRLSAYLIDLSIITSFSVFMFLWQKDSILTLVTFVQVFFFYHLLLSLNQTIGESLFSIRLDKKNLTVFKIFFRTFLLFLSPLTLGLFFIPSEEKVSGTRVLNE